MLFSGGHDSTVPAYLFRSHVTHAVHAKTGIGVEAARQFVRDVCAAWCWTTLKITTGAACTMPPTTATVQGSPDMSLILGSGALTVTCHEPGPHYQDAEAP